MVNFLLCVFITIKKKKTTPPPIYMMFLSSSLLFCVVPYCGLNKELLLLFLDTQDS